MPLQEALTIALSVLISVGGPVAIVIVAIVMNHLSKKKRYEAMVKAIELGGTKDPEAIKQLFLVDKSKEKSNGAGYLKGGIIVCGVGVGLGGMAMVVGENEMLAPAVFSFILGLALVLVYMIIRPKPDKK
jgi:hypothetical protein